MTHQWWCGGKVPCACTEMWKLEQREKSDATLFVSTPAWTPGPGGSYILPNGKRVWDKPR